jgi:23S rRNA pseudouridine1911/1915/1917 synthase
MNIPKEITLPGGLVIPILYENRSVLAIDKPAHWLLAPDSWEHTGRDLQRTLVQSVAARDFWARSRHLHFIRYIHRLDAETSGVLLLAKNPGVVRAYSELFSGRRVTKIYLAAVSGDPKRSEWTCSVPLSRDPRLRSRMRVKGGGAQPAETRFRVLTSRRGSALVEARPLTGRTHQIRVHLAHSGHPVLGDILYGPSRAGSESDDDLGLRAVGLAYDDPFRRHHVRISAPSEAFTRRFGFEEIQWSF